MGGMFHEDRVYGGARLNEYVAEGQEYVLFDCAIVATNVSTSIGEDGTKAELVLALIPTGSDGRTNGIGDVVKVGTFASAIVAKIEKKEDGDLPAVVKFESVPSKFETDAFVMTFVRRYRGAVPDDLPVIEPLDPDTAPY